jgi:hypothetical protein
MVSDQSRGPGEDMRTINLLITALLFLSTGCASKFTGEWLEEGQLTEQGEIVPPQRERLWALQFGPLSAVRIGAYLSNAKIVDAETVQSAQYVVFDGDQRAQFGALIAEVQDNHLVVTMQGEPQRRFVKVHGKSIFPPLVRPPQLSRGGFDPTAPFLEQYALADPFDEPLQP